MYKLKKYDEYLDQIEYYIENIEGNPEREKEYKLYQLYNSKQYAERLGLRLKKDFDKQIFSNYFQKELLKDMFSLDNPIKFKFRNYKKVNIEIKPTIIELPDTIKEVNKKLEEDKLAILSRDDNKVKSMENVYTLYNDSLVELLTNFYKIKDVNNNWISMYEILKSFPKLLNNTLYIPCSNKGVMNSIKYYTKDEKTNIITGQDCGKDIYEQITNLFKISDGSNCVIRLSLGLDMTLVSLIYILFNQFKNIYFYKTMKNPESKYFYLIGINYKKLNEKIVINKNKDYSLVSSIPDTFIKQLEKYIEKLYDEYDRYIEKEIYYIDNIDNISKEHIKDIMDAIFRKNKDWVNEFL